MPCQGKLTPALDIRTPRGDVGPQAQSICKGSVESSCRSSRTEVLLYAKTQGKPPHIRISRQQDILSRSQSNLTRVQSSSPCIEQHCNLGYKGI